MRKWPSVALALAAVVLAACAAPPVPQDQFYRIEAPAAESVAGKRLDGVLEVARLVADGLAGGRAIVYSQAEDPLQVNEYHYHFWSEPPAIMLRDQLIRFLRDAEVAQTIVAPEARLEPAYTLSGRIYRLERIVGAQPRGAIELELVLHERRSSGPPLLLRTYRVEKEAAGDSIAASVAALNAGFAEICRDLLADLQKR